MLTLEEVWKGREVGALEKDMEESPLPWSCTGDYAAGSVDWWQVQSTGDQTSRLVTHQGSSTCCSTHVIGREVMECLDWHESKYSRATKQGSSSRMMWTPLICARSITLKINMLKDSWSTGGQSCGVTTKSCRSSGSRRNMAWRSCSLFDLANSCC